MLLQNLVDKQLIHPPDWLVSNCLYLTTMGSMAYGCNESESDIDIYGFCIPKKEMIFPHLIGQIDGFGRQIKRFDQWQEHHIFDQSAKAGRGQEYDFSVYSIVKYFQLLMDNNANVIDSLFTPRECVIHSTHVWEIIRDRRKIFLHKGCYWKFTGYAMSQLNKMTTKDPKLGSKRLALREKYGYDVKFASHIYRLINECEQILTEGDLDLRRSAEGMRDIRNGNWSEQQIRDWFMQREPILKKAYDESQVIPYKPDEEAIKTLLLECLEHHYGNLEKCVVLPDRHLTVLREIKQIVERANV